MRALCVCHCICMYMYCFSFYNTRSHLSVMECESQCRSPVHAIDNAAIAERETYTYILHISINQYYRLIPGAVLSPSGLLCLCERPNGTATSRWPLAHHTRQSRTRNNKFIIYKITSYYIMGRSCVRLCVLFFVAAS